jgi:hypothetical protein
MQEVHEFMKHYSPRARALPLVLSLVGCASDSSGVLGSAGSVATSATPAPTAGASAPLAAASAQQPASATPAAAIAAIPTAMRPTKIMPELMSKLLVPDVANAGVAMFTDIVTVPPGGDITFCSYTSAMTTERIYLHGSEGVQSKFGHHAIMQYTTKPQAVGTHACAPDSLEAQQSQVMGGSGDEGTGAVKLAPNVVSEIPAGAQFIINHHWINSSDAPIDVQAEMITIPPPAGTSNLLVARSFIVQPNGFSVAPHQAGQDFTDCVLDHDVSLVSILGHEHEWGTHVRAEKMGSSPAVMFDHDYDPSMVSHPVVQYFPADAPYQLKKGDTVRMSCQWQNTTDQPLTFPGEMCVLSGWQIGFDHDSMCFSGQWVE